jgi:hypothetical protein
MATERFTLTEDNVSFNRHKGIRIGTLWCSKSDIDGDVTLNDEFDSLDRISKLDLLSDVIGMLRREYNIILNTRREW